MSALALALLLFAPAETGAGACDDVFDRSPGCAAVDVEALPLAPDETPPLEARDDVGATVGWRFLAGAVTATALSGVGAVVVFIYNVQLAELREANAATPEAVGPLLFQRSIATIASGGLLVAASMLAGTSLAFLIFDVGEGRPREPFRVEE